MIKKNVIAIIPARGGSKGIPRKNIKLLNGKPLIAYSIEQAKASKFIDRVFVSTEDKEISEISKEYGSEIIQRPKELSEDNTIIMPVLKHAVNYVEKELNFKVDVVVLLQPTSPLRKVDNIDESIEKLLKEDYDSVTTVYRIEHNINTLVKIKNGKTEYFVDKPSKILRQEAEKIYRIDGNVFVLKKEVLLNKGEGDYIVSDNNGFVIISEESALDIDTPFDLKLAEFFMKNE